MGFVVASSALGSVRRAAGGAKATRPSGLVAFALPAARSRQIMSQPISPPSTKRKGIRSTP